MIVVFPAETGFAGRVHFERQAFWAAKRLRLLGRCARWRACRRAGCSGAALGWLAACRAMAACRASSSRRWSSAGPWKARRPGTQRQAGSASSAAGRSRGWIRIATSAATTVHAPTALSALGPAASAPTRRRVPRRPDRSAGGARGLVGRGLLLRRAAALLASASWLAALRACAAPRPAPRRQASAGVAACAAPRAKGCGHQGGQRMQQGSHEGSPVG